MQASQIKQSLGGAGLVRSQNPIRASHRVAFAAPGVQTARRFNVVVASATETDGYTEKYPSWDSIYKQLNFKYGLKSISVDEAAILIDEGKAVLLDVRLAEDFAESHPKDAASVPAFRIIKAQDGVGFSRMLKSLLMKANGVTPTEGHPEFPTNAAAVAGAEKVVILACEAGGSPLATSTFPTGKASRSLKAAWKLLHTGVLPAERVVHLDGGVLAWYKAGLRMEGNLEYDPSKAGRTPNAVPLEKDA